MLQTANAKSVQIKLGIQFTVGHIDSLLLSTVVCL